MAESLWTVEDVANYTRFSVSWVYKRIAPNTKLSPKIPRVQNLAHPRFDPTVIKAIFPASSSVTSEKVGKSEPLEMKPKVRQKERLW